MKKPNAGDYLTDGALHTIEHLFATFARNSELADRVIYVGPMGCRTGFYLLLRDTVSGGEAIDLVRDSMAFIAAFEGEIPGSKRKECGNYISLDLQKAKDECARYLAVVKDWKEDDLAYPHG